MKALFRNSASAALFTAFLSSTAFAAIGPGPLPSYPSQWDGNAQVKLGWAFSDPTNPNDHYLGSPWDRTGGVTVHNWDYQLDREEYGQPAQWHFNLPQVSGGQYVRTYVWFSFVYDYDKMWTAPPNYRHSIYSSIIGNRADGSQASEMLVHTYPEEYLDANGNAVDHTQAVYARFTQIIQINQDIASIDFWLGTDFYDENAQRHRLGNIHDVYLETYAHLPVLPTPTFAPGHGTYVGGTSVVISCAESGATLYYTTDGQDPSHLGITSATAEDSSLDMNNGALQNSPLRVASTVPLTSPYMPGNAMKLDGVSEYVSTTTEFNNPEKLTIECWFKTTTSKGGKLIGFGSLKTGASIKFDRHIYMSDDGTVNFGVYLPGPAVIKSVPGYNDGTWHHVAATFSTSAGMCLYVDGAQTAVALNWKTVDPYSGYWRIGYDSMGAWPDMGSSDHFAGELDEVRVWYKARSLAEINSTRLTTLAGDEDYLVGYWRFDEGIGTHLPNGGTVGLFEQSCTLKAKAWLDNWYPSYVKSGHYTLKVPAPEFLGGSPTAFAPFDVQLVCPGHDEQVMSGVTIYYTTDGTDPTTGSSSVTNAGPVRVDRNMVIKAMGVRSGWDNSDVSRSENYTLKVSKPTLVPSSGAFFTATNIHAFCTTPDARIHYTINGGTPTMHDAFVTNGGPIHLEGNATVKAKGFHDNWDASQLTEGYYLAGPEYVYLGDLITTPTNGYHDADHPPEIISMGDGGMYVTNITDSGSVTNIVWSNIVTRVVFIDYTNITLAMNFGEVQINWWTKDFTSNDVKQLYVILDGVASNRPVRTLYWNQPPSRGPIVDVSAVPKLTFYYNENIPAPTNTHDPEGVYIDNKSGNKKFLRAKPNPDKSIGHLVLLYESGIGGPFIGVEVVHVMPDVGWTEARVPIGSELKPVKSVTNWASPSVLASAIDDKMMYQNQAEGKMLGAVFPIVINELAPLMTVFFMEAGLYDVSWPYEQRRFTTYWPDETDEIMPAQIYVRGTVGTDLGASIAIPGKLNPALQTEELYENENDHGFYDTGTKTFHSSGPGYSLIRFMTDNGDGMAGSEWVGFEVIKSVMRTNLFWKYRRTITLSAATPKPEFQVAVVLPPSFTYGHVKPDGADIRFYDSAGIECAYYLETWDTNGTSVVWVNVRTAGSDELHMLYGNPNATALSSTDETFILYDSFDNALAEWGVRGNPPISNGEVTLNAGDQLIALAPVPYGALVETLVGSGGITPVSGTRGSFSGVSSLSGSNVFYTSDNPINSRCAAWNIGRNGSVALAGITADGRYADYGASLAGVVAGDVMGVAVESNSVAFLRNGVKQGSELTQHIPTGEIYPILNSYNDGSTSSFRISEVRVRKYAATEPVAVLGDEAPGDVVDWFIGDELEDVHRGGHSPGYIYPPIGTLRYFPESYSYPALDSQVFAVNTGTIEVWWCSWILTNFCSEGILIPSFVRQYNDVWMQIPTNHALLFDGSADYVETKPHFNNLSNWTFSAWIKPSGSGFVYSEGNPLETLRICLASDGKLEVSSWNNDLPGNWMNYNTPAGAVEFDEWNFISVVLENGGVGAGEVTVYIKKDKYTGSLQMENHAHTPYAALGRSVGSLHGGSQSASPFHGVIDEVRLWNTARSETEILADANCELHNPRDKEHLVAYYEFNEGAGVVAGDSSRFHNQGALHGPPTWTRDAAPLLAAAANYRQIVIASGEGTGPIDPNLENYHVYYQNDPSLIGYNPNDEHAIRYGEVIYALRSDLGSTNTSLPHVVMPYRDPYDNGRWAIAAYQVLATNDTYTFDYTDCIPARPIEPPNPLRFWPNTKVSYVHRGPAWQDRKNTMWAIAAGNHGETSNTVIRFYYDYFDGYGWYFPSSYTKPDGKPYQVGDSVPWLDIFAGTPHVPEDITYTIHWTNFPVLNVCDTLVKAKNGLPDVADQSSVKILYDQSEALGNGPCVTLIDPTRIIDVPLTEPPSGIQTEVRGGLTYFPTLPPNLNERLWYDPSANKLRFKGEYIEPALGLPYLLLNVIDPADSNTLVEAFKDSTDAAKTAVKSLCGEAEEPIVLTDDTTPFDSLALTAGQGQGTGYVTIVCGNSTNLTPVGEPVTVYTIEVHLPIYRGQIEDVESEDIFAELLTLQHSGDFAGHPEGFIFDWRYDPGYSTTNYEQWIPYPMTPETGEGVHTITIEGASEFGMVNHNFVLRYRHAQSGYPGGTDWSPWTDQQLAEGWVQRVLDALTPFEQRWRDLFESRTINTLVSMIGQAGGRWSGDVPLRQSTADDFGLIQLYQTIFNRAINFTIGADPPQPAPADVVDTLLLAAGRLSDLYTLLGNEAYADAEDPTIAIGTDDVTYGNEACTLFCFMNQVPSLLDETVELLRGRGSGSPGSANQDVPPITTQPVYNKLIWNFTVDIVGGEVAYALNYNILDENGNADGVISEDDAKILYPQGHGDAWGHYLSSMMYYYCLLHNPMFSWTTKEEAVLVGGVGVAVNYLHERKFASDAAAKARAGAEIVQNTYKSYYEEDTTARWQGYRDGDTNRAWGVAGWATRAGMGAYFDWVVANAILPIVDTAHTGIQKIDRTNVTQLADIANGFAAIQCVVDDADAGMNPLGIARNVVPFDIDPSLIYSPEWVPNTSKSHFEQIYDRATIALLNAERVFNHARNCTQNLRKQENSLAEFNRAIEDQEWDYDNRLIDIFGYPYPDDIGPRGAYPDGYDGPDLIHWMYIENTELANNLPIIEVVFTAVFYTVSANGAITTNYTREIAFHFASDSQILVKPASFQSPRKAQGEIQRAWSEVMKSRNDFDASAMRYANLVQDVQDKADEIEQTTGLLAKNITLISGHSNELHSLNDHIETALGVKFTLELFSDMAFGLGKALAQSVIKNEIFGLADGGDLAFPVRAILYGIANTLGFVLKEAALLTGITISEYEHAKELLDVSLEFEQAGLEKGKYVIAQVAELEHMVRQIGVCLLELYTLQESYSQALGYFDRILQDGYAIIDRRTIFRKQTAAQIQEYRYNDMAFRIFRNDALQKYHAQFDLAARYAYLAVKAYDYETNLSDDDPRGPGKQYLESIVKQSAIGLIENDEPVVSTGTGDGGLADTMARMNLNWTLVLRPQLGFNNPQAEVSRFSLRSELFRCVPGALAGATLHAASGDNDPDITGKVWRTVLESHIVSNLFDMGEFNRYCVPFSPHNDVEPAIVIPFSTTIKFGQNYFGWNLAGGDNAYDSSHFATKVRTVGIWFSNYDNTQLANEPRVYLVPVGEDVMRHPDGSGDTREWTVIDQALPVPFPVDSAQLADPGWIPMIDTLSGGFADIRRFTSIRAYNDSGDFTPEQATCNTRLIGRSVWNTRWLLIIPAGTLHSDRQFGLDTFIENISDIKIFFQTYSYTGN